MTDSSFIGQAHLRVARPTDRIPEMIKFYRDGLGFEVLSSFEDHDGFDGVILGHPSSAYHLEFTHHRGDQVANAPGKDNLLVFYFPNRREWEKATARMRAQGYEPVWSSNPFWNVRGRTFEDADGYRIVLQQAAWP